MTAPLLEVAGLSKTFGGGRQLLGRARAVPAVDGVSFEVAAGETFGLVGESGSGKSTTARLILRLLEADAGTVRFEGDDVLSLRREGLKRFRRAAQIVFQDPYSSLDPMWTVLDIVAEPLRTHGAAGDPAALRQEVVALLDRVGLDAGVADRYANELSGGQRQRVAIARAVALHPKLIVCDEPVSALDVSTQAQIVSLLADLQLDEDLAYVFISHDLALVRQISQRIAVMLRGRLVEVGPADTVYHAPAHPYTQALVAAVPVADPDRQRQRRLSQTVVAEDGGPGAATRGPVPGCPFQHRCPAVMDICRTVDPPMISVALGHRAACHLRAATRSTAPAALATLHSDNHGGTRP